MTHMVQLTRVKGGPVGFPSFDFQHAMARGDGTCLVKLKSGDEAFLVKENTGEVLKKVMAPPMITQDQKRLTALVAVSVFFSSLIGVIVYCGWVLWTGAV